MEYLKEVKTVETLCTLMQFDQYSEPQKPDCDIKTFGTSLNGEAYIIVKQSGIFQAFINRCPHLQIPLEWQEHHFLDNDTHLLRCSTHGALFMISNGECVSGPCTGESLIPVNIEISNNCIALISG